MAALLAHLLDSLPAGEVRDVRIGLRWTAVVVEVDGEVRCGLSSTLCGSRGGHGHPIIPQADELQRWKARDLAGLAHEEQNPTLASLGMAAVNALLPEPPATLSLEGNAENLLKEEGAGRRVAVVGHFPFIPRLREAAGELLVLELDPREGDLPAEKAPEILPSCDVIAITGMTLVNHSLEGLLSLCPKDGRVMVLGPSTPLSPLLFEYGVDWLSGSIVRNVEAVLRVVSQGGNFPQIHRAGVQLVTMDRALWEGRKG